MKKQDGSPDQFIPLTSRDLIGPARKVGAKLFARARRLHPACNWKLLLYGPWGTGKTAIVRMILPVLGSGFDIEKVNGRNVSTDVVREWQRNACFRSLFGGWKIKHIDEVDLVPLVAQDLMLTFLDDLPDRSAVICTSNLSLETLTERFQTRFELVRVNGPTDAELAKWLQKRWTIPQPISDFIALGAGGNVRQALLDATSFLTLGHFDERPKPPAVVKDPAATARALKAWETMRGRGAA
jgi:replication-associated recombination protein RarA